MKKLIASFLLLGLVQANLSYAAANPPAPSLWESLRKKVEAMTPKKKLSTTTAAGGVRGSLADADDVYWMGESKPVYEDELAAFKRAIALADMNDKSGAQAAFADFIKQSPDSPLRGEAEAALKQLKSGQ